MMMMRMMMMMIMIMMMMMMMMRMVMMRSLCGMGGAEQAASQGAEEAALRKFYADCC